MADAGGPDSASFFFVSTMIPFDLECPGRFGVRTFQLINEFKVIHFNQ